MRESGLLRDYLEELALASAVAPALDLACGRGRNGLYLVRRGIPVLFADRDPEALASIREQLDAPGIGPGAERAALWQVDLERPGVDPLTDRQFGAILVFRYLHRPLLPAIGRALQPGGLLVYETFTVEQPRFGRPTNPDFLLEPGELPARFAGWDILHSFEGVVESPGSGEQQAIARLVARKPADSA